MAVATLDAIGLKCPQPVLRVAAKAREFSVGDILEVLADCPTFEQDIRNWADRMNKVILSVKNERGDKRKIQIQF
jgi:tRNA 2-thiouridine synthesizing protein A